MLGISNIADACKSFFDLLKAALPSDAVRLARFKARYPIQYAKKRQKLEDYLFSELIKTFTKPTAQQVQTTITWEEKEALPTDELADLITVMELRFGFEVPTVTK